MCGIFALLNNKYCDKKKLEEACNKGKDRGPEYSHFLDLPSINCSLGFHRLAINGAVSYTQLTLPTILLV